MASTIDLKQYEVWFMTGSQHLYGPQTLEKVNEHATTIAAALDRSPEIAVRVVFKPVLTSADELRRLCLEANSREQCVGLVAWMHTFSPAKMWIAGLSLLQKPLAHLHTQYNREIPWADIDNITWSPTKPFWSGAYLLFLKSPSVHAEC